MSFFRAFQLNMRNALVHAEHAMRLTKENFKTTLALIDVLSDQRFELFGLGEDVAALDHLELADDRLVVAPHAPPGTLSGTASFAVCEYPWALRVEGVLLEGEGVSWKLRKTYPDKAPAEFGPHQLPLITDNLQLIVTVAPGGYLKRAVVLQRVTME
jgi:hypothetical protein